MIYFLTLNRGRFQKALWESVSTVPRLSGRGGHIGSHHSAHSHLEAELWLIVFLLRHLMLWLSSSSVPFCTASTPEADWRSWCDLKRGSRPRRDSVSWTNYRVIHLLIGYRWKSALSGRKVLNNYSFWIVCLSGLNVLSVSCESGFSQSELDQSVCVCVCDSGYDPHVTQHCLWIDLSEQRPKSFSLSQKREDMVFFLQTGPAKRQT